MTTLRTFLLFGLTLCLMSVAHAQQYLSLDSAIARALAHNYDVRIADVSTQIAGANNTLGNAGLLPTVSGTANINEGISNTRLVRADGEVTERQGASTLSYNAGINASYTVFAAGRAYLLKR